MLQEDLADQLAAAPDAGLGEDRLEMVLDGVRRQGKAFANCLVESPCMHSRVSWDSRSDGELPGGYDVFLLANLIHYWSAEQNQELLQAVLMAGEFAVHLRTGDVDSVDEARGWLDRTGWRFVDHRPPAGPQSLIVAEAA